ncbi:unnamed protein product [Prunus armeniaca]
MPLNSFKLPTSGTYIVVLLLYVDDIILTGSNDVLVQHVVDDLSSVFELKDMGKLTYFLGLQISYSVVRVIFVNRVKYAKDLLKRAGMSTCRACPTPCKPHTQVSKTEGEPLSDPIVYKSICLPRKGLADNSLGVWPWSLLFAIAKACHCW